MAGELNVQFDSAACLAFPEAYSELELLKKDLCVSLLFRK